MPAGFPFSAIVGQDKAKQALLMLAVNEQLHSVMLAGDSGTGKSTLIRGFVALMPTKQGIPIPLNVTEDRLLGGIDLEYALQTGTKRFLPGLLANADGNVLTVDDLNLLADGSRYALLQAITSRAAAVEREGMSVTYPSAGLLVATMNPQEGELSAAVLDHFGLYAVMKQVEDSEARAAIIRANLAFEHNSAQFLNNYSSELEQLQTVITTAKQFLAIMQVKEQIIELAALTTLYAHCHGHRADYYLIEAAKAIAALAGRSEVNANDVRLAAEFVLLHRLGNEQALEQSVPPESVLPELKLKQNDEQQDDKSEPEQEQEQESHEDRQSHSNHNSANNEQPAASNQPDEPEESSDQEQHSVMQNADTIEAIGIVREIQKLSFTADADKLRSGTGKRSKTKTGTKQGRYVRANFPHGKEWDIAFDATLRAAAPYQRMRPTNGKTAWHITKEDIREKVREKRVGVTMMFVVDASRSMAAQKRMQAVKGAILSLLQDAYQKRDRVGMVVFRQQQAEEVLAITRSVTLAEKQLRELPTGGKTPLVLGLKKGYELLRQAMRRDPEIVPVMIVVTDGKANVGLQSGASIADIIAESRQVGDEIHAAGIHSLILDTEQGFVKLHYAQALAQAMQAQYIQLEQIGESRIAETVRNVLNRN